jgi:alkaline phosphatase
LAKDPDGFWLMVEGGDIDWSAHDNNIDNLIGTVLDFDKTVGSVISWIEQNGGWENNQLIVTADHDHYLTLNGDYPTLLQTQGAQALTEIDTIEGSGNVWGTSTTDKYGWGNHTNRPVPVYYQGPDSVVLDASVGQGFESYGFDVPGIPGLVDQVHIAETMFDSVTEENEKDLVSGTTGTDILIAEVNIDGVQDTIFTGAGNDEIDLAFNADARRNRINAGTGADTIYVSRRDRAFGSDGNDVFDATDGKGENRMSGGAGDDVFFLGTGDRALGGDGIDKFFFGTGGNNFVSGGAGADQFWIYNAEAPSSPNTVLDFQIGTDVLGIGGSSFKFADLTLVGETISLGGTEIATLSGINASSLTAANFSFI